MAMLPRRDGVAGISLAQGSGALPDRLRALLASLSHDALEVSFSLDQICLRLGQRLPDQAQTITYWQRGELGRALRAEGFAVRVEYGGVIFMRHVPSTPPTRAEAAQSQPDSGQQHDSSPSGTPSWHKR
jgi:hypothetical protein